MSYFEWQCFTLVRLFKLRNVKDAWNGHLLDLIDKNVVLQEFGEPEYYEFHCFFSNHLSSSPRVPIEAEFMDLVEDKKLEGNLGACYQHYSIEKLILIKYSLNQPLALNKFKIIIIRPLQHEDAIASVEIHRVLSQLTEAEPEPAPDVSSEGGPKIPSYYASRENGAGEIE